MHGFDEQNPTRYRRAYLKKRANKKRNNWRERNERDCNRRDGQGRERSRSPPLSPPEGRRHADPGRSHRRRRRKSWSASATTRWCSCPANSCFPAAASTSPTTAFRSPRPIPKALEENLLKGSPKITAVARALADDRRDPRGLRGNRALSRAQGQWRGAELEGAVEAVCRGRPAARPVRPVPDRARDHPARPRPALRYPLLHRGCLRHRPSRRGRDPCRCRTGRTGLGRDRLKAAGRPASDDQECAERTGKAPRHRAAAATTRRCRSSISTAARCRRTCWGRSRTLSSSLRGAKRLRSQAIQLSSGRMDCFAALSQ